MNAPATTPENALRDEPLLRIGYRRLFVAVMFLVCLFNFADRAVFAVLAQTIKQEFSLTDFEIGILQGLSFAILYAGLGLPIGRLAERTSRIRIVATATILWSAATFTCGLTANFAQLMLARAGVGIGEAGFMPPTASLVADHFPRVRRASIIALIMIGSPVGLFLGSIVGGAVGQAWGWRYAFFALGVPGLLTGVLVLLVLREPSRGLVDRSPPAGRAPPDFKAFMRELVRKRALLFVILGGGFAGFGMTSISQFLAVFLARAHHMQVREAAAYYGGISAVSLTLGLMIGSFGTDWLSKRDERWPAWGAAFGLCAAPFIYWVAFTTHSKPASSLLLVLAGTVMLLFYGPTQGMIQNMLEPRMRATGSALFGILYTLIGAGLGPAFVGAMSDHMARKAFTGVDFLTQCPGGPRAATMSAALDQACRGASLQGLRSALMIAVCVLFVASGFYLLAARSLREHMYYARAEN